MTAPSRTPLLSPTPETLRDQVVLEAHDVAPDGSCAVVSRRTVTDERYVSDLWLVQLEGGEPRRLTNGTCRDTRPAISPDGHRVAFGRKQEGTDRTALLVQELAGGEPFELPLGDLSVGEIAWAPDGRSIAFIAEAGDERFIVGPRPKPGDQPRARRVTVLDYRWDEEGYLDRRAEVFVIGVQARYSDPGAELATGAAEPRQLTSLWCGVEQIAWRPDSGAIAFVADPRPDADRRPRTSIWEVGVGGDGGSEPREILALAGPASRPAWSPDGRLIAAVGVDDPDFFDDLAPSLFVGPADGSRRPLALAPELDRPIGTFADSDLTGWTADSRPGPAWDGEAVVALVTDRGRTLPWRFPVDPTNGEPAGEPERLAGGDVMAQSLAVGAGRVTLLATVGARPPELCAVEGGIVRPVTTMGSSWIDALAWPDMQLVDVRGPGGPIETWVASPAGAGDGPLPTIVDVHGGPLGAWAPAPSLEVVLLCARGYRVVLPNIRGSASYGAAWIAPHLGNWGGPDAEDVHAALDHVVQIGLADPARLGALGLSYGGFLVNWLVGTSDRFGAAVSENGVTNQLSAWAHSDCGPEYCRAARMGDPTTPAGVEQLWRQSPLRNVADVRTPLLMLQAEADRRCPPADNEQFFAALRWLGREVEYVLYPEEYHLLQAAGRIDRRIDRMTRVLDWFDRFLRPARP